MVTCDPNKLVPPTHPKAMSTVLHAYDHQRWLDGSYDDVVALQRQYPSEWKTARVARTLGVMIRDGFTARAICRTCDKTAATGAGSPLAARAGTTSKFAADERTELPWVYGTW